MNAKKCTSMCNVILGNLLHNMKSDWCGPYLDSVTNTEVCSCINNYIYFREKNQDTWSILEECIISTSVLFLQILWNRQRCPISVPTDFKFWNIIIKSILFNH